MYPEADFCTFFSLALDQSSVFNVFKSAIAYDTSIKTLPNIAKDGGEEQMVEYEFEPDTKEEVMQVRNSIIYVMPRTRLKLSR